MSALAGALRTVRSVASISRTVLISIYALVAVFSLFNASSTSWGHMCPLSMDSDGTESTLVVSTCDWIEYMDSHRCPFERIADQCSSVSSACNCDESIRNILSAQSRNSSDVAGLQLRVRDVVPKCTATVNADFTQHAAIVGVMLLFVLTRYRNHFDTEKVPSMGAGEDSVYVHRGPSFFEMGTVMFIFSLQLLVTLHRLALTGAIPDIIAPGVTTADMHTSGAQGFNVDTFMHSFLVCVPDNDACGSEGGAVGSNAYTWRRLIDVDFLGMSVYAVVGFTELVMFYLLLLEILTVLAQYLTHDKNNTPDIGRNKDASANTISNMLKTGVQDNNTVRMRKVQAMPFLASHLNHQ